jgi:hypothetical protein
MAALLSVAQLAALALAAVVILAVGLWARQEPHRGGGGRRAIPLDQLKGSLGPYLQG